MLCWVETGVPLDVGHIVSTKSGAVCFGVACDFASDPNHCADIDEHRLVCATSCLHESRYDALDIMIAVQDIYHFPTTRGHLCIHVLGVGEINGAVTCDLIVVIDHNQVVEPEVPGQGNCL